jgi:hypothetical protein
VLLRTTKVEGTVLGCVLRLARARSGGGLNATAAFLGLLDELSARAARGAQMCGLQRRRRRPRQHLPRILFLYSL